MKAILILFSAAAVAGAAPAIVVRPVASVSAGRVVLDLTADTGGEALRGFGVRVGFDSGVLRLASAGSYPGLWFLRSEDGVRHPYTDARTPATGTVTLVGGRFDADSPAAGLTGDGMILGTLVFDRLTTATPKFQLGLAEPGPFTNFASTAGDSLDAGVTFAALLSQAAPVDSEPDGLPDAYELATFGNLTTANATSDFDGDGESDLDEYLRGTDPRDRSSRSRFEVIVQADRSKLIRWQGATGRVYDILWSGNLGPFQEIRTGIPGANAIQQQLDTLHNALPRGFYKLRAQFPDRRALRVLPGKKPHRPAVSPAPPPHCALAAAAAISSSLRSLTRVAIDHRWPQGSSTIP